MALATRPHHVLVLAFLLATCWMPVLAQHDRVQVPGRVASAVSDVRAVASSPITTLPAALRPALAEALARDALRSGEDPQVWVEQRVMASDPTDVFQFGWAVAVDGSTAVISAKGGIFGIGAVYVFTETDGVWTEAQKLTASDASEGDSFGFAVALQGSTLLIGAAQPKNSANAVYVFTESGGTWSETQKLVPSGGGGEDFGYDIALDGTRAVVGAPHATVNGTFSAGAAYVLEASDGVWAEVQRITAEDVGEGVGFGTGVALDGETALVGAPVLNVDGRSGAAYVFEEEGGTWSQIQKLSAGGESDAFGGAVALEGTTALVGAIAAPIEGASSHGAVYVFEEEGGAWSPVQTIDAGTVPEPSGFGVSVALDGATALIGSLYAAEYRGGAAYVYTRDGGTWTQTAKLTASDGLQNDSFSNQMAVDGGTALVGAFHRGRVYIFTATDAPEIVVNPTSLEVSVPAGGEATTSFTLSNTAASDAADLTFEIATAAAPTGAARVVEVASGTERADGLARADGRLGPASYVAYDGSPRALWRGEEVMLTHSLSQEIEDGSGIACTTPEQGTTENSYWRVFDLAEFDLAALSVTSVDVAIEIASVTGSPVSTVRLHTLDGPFQMANLTLIGEGTFELASTELQIVNVPVTAELTAGDVLVVEWNVPDLRPSGGSLFPGANSAGETAPSYLLALDCKFWEPTTYAQVGFPETHLVMNVHGLGTPALVVASPKSGSVAPGASQEITLTVNASQTEEGVYPVQALVATNDPVQPLLAVDVTVTVTGGTAAEGEASPDAFALDPVYPNPLAGRAAVRYALPQDGPVRLAVYDTAGRLVATLVDAEQPAGRHEVTWDARGLAAGVYFFRIEAGSWRQTQKVIVLT